MINPQILLIDSPFSAVIIDCRVSLVPDLHSLPQTRRENLGGCCWDQHARRFCRTTPNLSKLKYERIWVQVIVSEPSVLDTIQILRGIAEKYASFHGVRISDRALVAAAELSTRYIQGRFRESPTPITLPQNVLFLPPPSP